MGIRMAMGAEAGKVQALVLGEGLKVAAIGLLVGIGGAWGLTGIMESMLFDIGARDPLSFLLGPVVLTLVAIAACWIPARRATRVDPVTVLRQE
jgi:ABC-type antimicrobial peptide transport system permease subunit